MRLSRNIFISQEKHSLLVGVHISGIFLSKPFHRDLTVKIHCLVSWRAEGGGVRLGEGLVQDKDDGIIMRRRIIIWEVVA